MPPKKYFWPPTMEEFNRLAEEAKQKYLPLVDKLQPHELQGLFEAIRPAMENLRKEAHSEDVRRGHRPPGTRMGR